MHDEMFESDDRINELGSSLSESDKRAIDALFEDGVDADETRATRVEALMSLLSSPVNEERERDTRIAIAQLATRREHALTPTSAGAVDRYIEGETGSSSADERHTFMAEMVTGGAPYDSASRETLIERTLGAIQREIDVSEKRHIMDTPITPSGRFRLADLVSMAAMILIAASVVIPVMGGMRSRELKSICNNNLAGVAQGFGLYTGANRDTLPVATAGFGGSWMDVGTTPDRSNSSNLFVLVRNDYASLQDLACPTNPNALVDGDVHAMTDWRSLDEISYSYRVMADGGLKATSVDQPDRVVLLADRSPVVLRIVAGQPVRPEENTPNHDSRGQHILGLDGASMWTVTPRLGQGDNLWLPRTVEQFIYEARDQLGIIKGNEAPSGPTDAFVAP